MNREMFLNIMKKTGILIFWLMVWEILSLIVRNSLLVPSLGEIIRALAEILVKEDFCLVLMLSLGKILAGLFFAFMLGAVLAMISYAFQLIEKFLAPLFLCIKAIPVASYVILLLIWQGSEMLSVGISFLVVLPIVYTNILEGLKKTDRKYMEMADVFGVKGWNRLWYIYRPQLSAAILSCVKLGCGMGIKAGVAAEIIGIPKYSFGEMLYMSKIYLSMDALFAWTIVIVISALILEKLLLFLSKVLLTMQVPARENARLPMRNAVSAQNLGTIGFENVSKRFYNKSVVQKFNMQMKAGDVIGIMSPSGSGKSTLFRILLGLAQADRGRVEVYGRISAVFQDNLLCEEADVFTNMKLASSGTKDIGYLAETLLGKVDLHKKCSHYSGGMKRRAALARALSADYDILLLDEPFTALDDAAKEQAADLIKEQAKDKTILLFTHDEKDIKLLNGVCCNYQNLML